MQLKIRRSWRLAAVVMVAAVGLGAWGAVQVFAGSGAANVSRTAPIPAGKQSSLQPINAPNWQSTQLIHTYLQDNLNITTYTAGTFQPVDSPTTVNCNPPNQFHGTCGLEVDQSVQAAGTTSDQDSAICTVVDGNFLNCPYSGTLSPSHYTLTNGLRAVNLPAGFHTVQDYFYSNNNAFLGYYSFAYRLYGTG